ncbi:MAG TPA: sigma-70 family RNA polymerase sigma factor [Verrucomicrobiae bacterium]|nr:sigma-70 family RNA polymerase sigma factor [Verrucomicrobiae bacterium]
MAQNDSDLLKGFVTNHLEMAFTELVERHVDLVYSAALRQTNGDAHAADDIAQEVFKNLAAKAAQLTKHTSIAGWLFVNVRFIASNFRRTEHRRFVREQEAYNMNQLLQTAGPSPDWENLRPVIDETMCELDEEDREAILLRFFQGCRMEEIGARLGIKENTARMRIERALEKLRVLLTKRGITSTTAAISVALVGRAVSAAPSGFANKISRAILAGGTISAGGGLTVWITSTAAKFVLAGLIVAGGLLFFYRSQILHSDSPQPGLTKNVKGTNLSAGINPVAKNVSQTGQLSNAAANAGPVLNLYFKDPKTGKPVPNVIVEDRCWSKNKFKGSKYHGDKNGWCRIYYPSNVTWLELTSQSDGYADTRLDWHPERGDVIPSSYTLHLEKAVPIGGQVLDDDGFPVQGAKVGWNHEDEPAATTSPESHEFGWIEVTTDADGRWQINRIAGDMIHRLYGSARDSDYVDSALVSVGQDAAAEQALRKLNFTFKLGKAATIEGNVVDADGKPVPNAKILLGFVSGSDRRETTASVTGTFVLSGCKFGKNLLTASAPGFANSTEEINITTNSPLYRITLTCGNVLRLLVQDPNGAPVPHASAWLDTINQGPVNSPHFDVKRTQVDYTGKSDANGRIVWSNAPDGELKFQFSAPGYIRSEDFYFTADGQEHIVTLNPAVTVFGTVRDADSGELIPHFKIGIGWPNKNYATGQTNGQWSSIERFWPEFSGGSYSNSLEEAAIGGMKNPGYILKFQADGYRSFISRVIAPDEGKVQLDVSLHRETSMPITVLTPDGQPAADADVGLVSPGAQLQLLPGGFSHNSTSASLLQTDNAGHFVLPSDDTISRVVVACPDGFAETTPAELKQSPTITLQKWGQIEVTCLSGGQPVAGREYLLGLNPSTDNDYNAISPDFNAFHVTSDDDGKFTMARVPPGKHSLVRLIPQTFGNQKSWAHGNKTEVDILPGKTTTITLGNKGYTVMAAIEWPNGAPTDLQQVGGALHTPMPPLPEDVQGHPDLIQQYRQSPEFQMIAKTVKSFPMTMNADGRLVAEDVPPGEYTLSAYAFVRASGGDPASGMKSGESISVTVPADPPTGQLDADIIKFH